MRKHAIKDENRCLGAGLNPRGCATEVDGSPLRYTEPRFGAPVRCNYCHKVVQVTRRTWDMYEHKK